MPSEFLTADLWNSILDHKLEYACDVLSEIVCVHLCILCLYSMFVSSLYKPQIKFQVGCIYLAVF